MRRDTDLMILRELDESRGRTLDQMQEAFSDKISRLYLMRCLDDLADEGLVRKERQVHGRTVEYSLSPFGAEKLKKETESKRRIHLISG